MLPLLSLLPLLVTNARDVIARINGHSQSATDNLSEAENSVAHEATAALESDGSFPARFIEPVRTDPGQSLARRLLSQQIDH